MKTHWDVRILRSSFRYRGDGSARRFVPGTSWFWLLLLPCPVLRLSSKRRLSAHAGLKKWVEVGNSGVFRPEMLLPMGLPEDVSVIAWGLSLERWAQFPAWWEPSEPDPEPKLCILKRITAVSEGLNSLFTAAGGIIIQTSSSRLQLLFWTAGILQWSTPGLTRRTD